MGRDRQGGDELGRGGEHVPLPSGIHNRVAHPQVDVIGAHLSGRLSGEQAVVAAVVYAVEQLVVTKRHVDRLHDHELRTEFDHPVRVAWSVVDIDDDGIPGMVRVHLEIRRTRQPLIRPGAAPRYASRKRDGLSNHQPRQAG